ncbi:hypothetical protein [Rhizobium rhizogenes]|uniref:Uncharacterized protein n=1 Tax=Rhizobium rhizogenes NBRC 13257 TaxID=1220581 RepID=A0AA87PW71_RHIRH|nr:hypothetical protein [Rhizobium rhizogenes]NTG67244.1 hypothetical protein [Rhizobium rhizogenes]TRB14293.1 hypothetical protein EXN67_01340 [Rhizobium rhizogenes]TRB47083.1 hypothetical protein EXN73_01340 [Rhizobium rhizogenes]TRB64850.1 hypothetical protein EXN71_01340 [Rhizobium rhizogenes]GAJ91065.1 hypothetical protein RRH01S_01_05360 [Rhizobium rhizogenes NBRC 13257]
MTIHQPIAHSNRRALPRSLIARRPNQNAQEFQFAIGDFVCLTATGEPALVVSRTQTADCEDEYTIDFGGGDAAPADVFESEIEAIKPEFKHANAPMRQRRIFDFRWKFQIGQRIDYHGAPGVILSRHSTAKGCQFYNIWIDVADENLPFRWVFADALTARSFDCSTADALELA